LNCQEIFDYFNTLSAYFIKYPGARVLVQKEYEWNELIRFVQKNIEINFGMEIGTNNGGTFYSLCKLAQDTATLISVDLLDISDKRFVSEPAREECLRTFGSDNQKLYILLEDSTSDETVNKIREILQDNLLDYLFIDGSHRYDDVKKDFYNYRDMVRDTGVIVFHDISTVSGHGGVRKLWDEIKDLKEYYTYEFHDNNKAMGIGILSKKDYK